MKLHIALGWLAISLLSIAHCDAKPMAAAAATAAKKFPMRTTIIPDWNDVAKGGTKLTPDQVANYWNKLEKDDIKKLSSPLPTKSERKKAKKTINTFYDSAAQCLGKNFSKTITKTAFSNTMTRVNDCIGKEATMPKFAPITAKLAATTAAPTAKPTIAPTAKPGTTLAPTAKPVTTPAPTAKPGSTLASTAKPSVTAAPLEEEEDDDDDDTRGDGPEVDGDDDDDDDDDDTMGGSTMAPGTQPPSYPLKDTNSPSSFAPSAENPSTTSIDSEPSSGGFIPLTPSGDPAGLTNPGDDSDFPSSRGFIDDTLSSLYDENPTPAPTTWSSSTLEYPSDDDKPVSSSGSPSPNANSDSFFGSALSLPGDETNPSTDRFDDLTQTTEKETESPIIVSYVDPDTNEVKVIQLPEDIVTQPTTSDGTPLSSLDSGATDWNQPSTKETEPPIVVTYVDPDTNQVKTIQLPEELVTQPTTSDGTPLSAIAPQQQLQPVSPTRDTIYDFSVLDTDYSGEVSMAEWSAYVQRLRLAAQTVVAKTNDPVAVPLLAQSISFHYDSLWKCVQKTVASKPEHEEFVHLVALVEAHCYVKFRYSFLSAPPPFELIARKASTVSPMQIANWFVRDVASARGEVMGSKMTPVTQEDVDQYAKFARCVSSGMQNAPGSAIGRATYYHVLENLTPCLNSE